MHANAPLTPTGRRILCERIEKGRPVAHVAREMGISRPTAYKWWRRYCEGGIDALVDRRSAPHSTPNRLSQRRERRIIGLRVNRRWGPARIAGHLGLCRSTVWRVLCSYGISRLRDLDPPSGRRIRRTRRRSPVSWSTSTPRNWAGSPTVAGGEPTDGPDVTNPNGSATPTCTRPSTTTPASPTRSSVPTRKPTPASPSCTEPANGSPNTASPSRRS